MSSADRPKLRALADWLGILPEYTNAIDHRPCYTTDRAREQISAAFGFDGSTEAAAEQSLIALERRDSGRVLAPVRFLQQSERESQQVRAFVPESLQGRRFDWRFEISAEDGETRGVEGRCKAGGRQSFLINTAAKLPLGYHEAVLTLDGDDGPTAHRQRWIAAPQQCLTVKEVLGDARVFGVCANLYTLRSEQNDGVGNMTDLADLARFTAQRGGAFVGVNPLHVTRNATPDISPYNPVSRLFRNPIYLDIRAIPEFADCGEARSLAEGKAFLSAIEKCRNATHVDYAAIAAAHEPVLRALFVHFEREHQTDETPRGKAYRRFVQQGGDALRDFAVFRALDAHFRTTDPPPHSWFAWPAEFRDPKSPAVRTFREQHAGDVAFHQYVQFELDRQLAAACAAGRDAGLFVGLYGDLAVASAGDGFDAWRHPQLVMRDVELGAPPDGYALEGQTWGLPPLNPHRLADDGFRFWSDLLRSAMQHMGVLRIDHVMGLLRQFWVPRGETGKGGAYVHFPAQALFAIVALESRRNNALVIGEDLGTVPQGFSAMLARWGVLSYRMMYFERDRRGVFKPAARYSNRAFVAATTHDHPPMAGYFSGRDLDIRRSLGIIEDDDRLADELQLRSKDIAQLDHRLRREGVLNAAESSDDDRIRAAHAMLAKTPCPLLGLTLDDIAGEREPVNVPGVSVDRFPAWSRRMEKSLAEIAADPAVGDRLNAAADNRKCRR